MEAEGIDRDAPEERVKNVTLFGVTTATELTRLQGAVAEALAELGDLTRVEAVFGLEPGAVGELMQIPDFVALVEYRKSQRERYAQPDVDHARALTDKQRSVARCMILDDMSQEDAASKGGVTSRTVRNWDKDPFFVAYCAQLSAQREAEEGEDRKAENRELTELKRETRLVALRNVRDAVRNKDMDVSRQVALGLLKEKA